MTNLASVADLLANPSLRQQAYGDLLAGTRELCESVQKSSDAKHEAQQFPGWKMRKIWVEHYGLELRIVESTAANIPFTLHKHSATDAVVTVTNGAINVQFDGETCRSTYRSGSIFYLPAGVTRTTFASEHPTTAFAVLFGGPGERGKSAGPY